MKRNPTNRSSPQARFQKAARLSQQRPKASRSAAVAACGKRGGECRSGDATRRWWSVGANNRRGSGARLRMAGAGWSQIPPASPNPTKTTPAHTHPPTPSKAVRRWSLPAIVRRPQRARPGPVSGVGKAGRCIRLPSARAWPMAKSMLAKVPLTRHQLIPTDKPAAKTVARQRDDKAAGRTGHRRDRGG